MRIYTHWQLTAKRSPDIHIYMCIYIYVYKSIYISAACRKTCAGAGGAGLGRQVKFLKNQFCNDVT